MSGNPDEPRASPRLQTRLDFPDEFSLQEFFTQDDGTPTLVGPSDLESAIPSMESGSKPGTEVNKDDLSFVDQYWTHKPYAFVSIWRNRRTEEYRYFVVEPSLSTRDERVLGFLKDQLPTALDFTDQPVDVTATEQQRIIGETAVNLLDRFNILARNSETFDQSWRTRVRGKITSYVASKRKDTNDDIVAPEVSLDMSELHLDDEDVSKINYYLWRDYVWYGKIDPIKRDRRIEDISQNGYESETYVYHTELGQQLKTNVYYGQSELDSFVVNLAQRAEKGISRREPSVDATLPDGSRAQLTLGEEISEQGTNFTIRQFKDVPFTPVDLINWETMTPDAAVYLWMAIENHKSAIFAGGTASGKTTSLNAMSLCMPATERAVTIEDTPELQLPQDNHVSSTTRETYSDDESNAYDEYDLLENALRQRPDYIIMGEVRGEEGRDLLQTANTGHTIYSTFHADSSLEVMRRFSEDPINASHALFEGIDIIINQRLTDINGDQQRRVSSIDEIEEYRPTEGDFSANTVFQWNPAEDSLDTTHTLDSAAIREIKQQKGWSDEELRAEWERRKLVLAYLSKNNISEYAAVAATIQAYMSNPSAVLSRIADGSLSNRVDSFRDMQTINIDVAEEKEERTSRPKYG